MEKDLPFNFTFGHYIEHMMLGVMKREVRDHRRLNLEKKKTTQQCKRGALILLNCLISQFWKYLLLDFLLCEIIMLLKCCYLIIFKF